MHCIPGRQRANQSGQRFKNTGQQVDEKKKIKRKKKMSHSQLFIAKRRIP